MRKCPVCEEDVQDEVRYCKVCGEMLEPVLKGFVCSSSIKASIIPIWIIVSAISINALIVGYWLGSMVDWEKVRWHVHLN